MLECNGKYQAWTAYKEAAVSSKNAFKVGTYFHTEWVCENDLKLRVDGLDLDKVYESFVRQIAGDSLGNSKINESLKDSVEREEKINKIKRKIAALEGGIRREKQLNKQVKMNQELKELREIIKQMEEKI